MTHLFKNLMIVCVMGLILSSTAQAWWNDAWTQRKKITVDTSSAGGAITDPIGTAPILIRLHDGDFHFASARDDGGDLRFVAADDKTLLTYHIEKYDSLLGEAFVWVKVPDLKPGAQVSFWLYYGNTGDQAVPAVADAKDTYDADTVLVYHFSEPGKPAHDFTESGNDAQNAGPLTGGALIGSGLRLDGKSPVTIPASSSLAWGEGAQLTWSAWIELGVLQPNAIAFSRRDGGHDFLIGADNGVPFVEVNGSRSQGGAALAVNTWHHLAVVASGAQITLYLDGVSYATLNQGLPALNSPSLIGSDAPDAIGNVGLIGEMDELEISKVARPPGFIKLAAISQGVDSTKLLAVAQDEQPPAGWLSSAFGLFGVILKSVTIDGWLVIGVLVIMSAVSWFVMISKLLYLNRIEKGNALFLEEWRQIVRDLTALDHSDGELIKSMGGRINLKVQKLIRRSPLYRIYHIGSEEIGHRQAGDKILSSQSIQAIRASLDGGYVRENHRLNSGMVFLTISIAGGPFLGLLGTVIGVMITFAAIAATGEVNISAIAPGLAAALVATVAGLLVAIPALLGYNYLVSRIKNVTSDMQIFVDEFVTKMAEFYSPAATSVASDGLQALVDQFVPKLIQALSEHNKRALNGGQITPVNR
jgi:biopolymer transport protein ExbB